MPWLQKTVLSSTFDAPELLSDFGTITWPGITSGTLSGGLLVPDTTFDPAWLILNGLSIPFSGYYTITINAIAKVRGTETRTNEVSVSMWSADWTTGFQVKHARNMYGDDNGRVQRDELGSVSIPYTPNTPYADSSSHLIRFDVTPAQVVVTVDGAQIAVVDFAGQASSPIAKIEISARMLDLDSISIVDEHGEFIPEAGSVTVNAEPLGPVASVGQPAASGIVTVEASGFQSDTTVGAPTATTVKPILINRSLRAGSTHTTKYGEPTTNTQVTAQASGAAPATAVGTATAGTALLAQGVVPTTMFGTPGAGFAAHVRTFAATAAFGWTKAVLTQHAGSTYLVTRFGAASVHSGSINLAEPAATVALFGTHSILRGVRAMSVAPSARFGRPTVNRGVLC
jgi:hypothetical protein